MLVSIALIYTSLTIIKDSIYVLFSSETYTFSIWLCIVSIITILIKLALYLYTKFINKKLQNILIEANSKDHRNDCLVALLNLISSILGYFGIYNVDRNFWYYNFFMDISARS